MNSNHKIRLSVLSFILVGAGALMNGCGGSSSGGAGPDSLLAQARCPSTGFVALPSSCCDGGGNQTNFAGDCSLATATTPPLLGALTGAATAAQVAQNANAAASQLIGKSGKVMTGGSLAAATAGGMTTGTPPALNSKKDIASTGQAPLLAPAKAGNASGGGSSDSSGSNTMAAMGMDYGSGARAAGPSQGNAAAATAGQNNAVAGADGGGTFRMPASFNFGASRGSGFGFSDGSGGAGPNTDALAFNGQGGVSPLGSSDPADYFTRVNLDDNLFKVVEKRYRKKALGWAAFGLKMESVVKDSERPKLDIEGLK